VISRIVRQKNAITPQSVICTNV